MNSKRIDRLIPYAFTAITENLADNNTVDSVYASYVAAFGPTVRYVGLLQTVLFYEGDAKKKKINTILWKILKQATPGLPGGSLHAYIQGQSDQRTTKERVLEAVVALKLAIRAFELKKDKGESHADLRQ
jgi:CRISPR-associated protein Cmr5